MKDDLKDEAMNSEESGKTAETPLILTDTFSTAHVCVLCHQKTLTWRDDRTPNHYCLPCLETAVDEAETERHAYSAAPGTDPRWAAFLGAVAAENWRLLIGAIGAASDHLPPAVFGDALYPGA